MSAEEGHDNFLKARGDALSLIQGALEFLEGKRAEQLVTAEIDPERLNAIAAAASASAFSMANAEFPIPNFEAITTVNDLLEPFTIRLTSVERGAYTKPLMAQVTSNESIWWSETMADRVAWRVLRDVLDRAQRREVTVATPEEYWAVVKHATDEAEREGTRGLLLVENELRPRWLYDWRYGRLDERTTPAPADLTISQSTSEMAGYLFHMNTTPVYQAPVERTCSYLLPASILRRVEFTVFPSGLLADVQFEQEANDKGKGAIRVTFARKVSLGSGYITQIRHG